jgi:hypothetical protein
MGLLKALIAVITLSLQVLQSRGQQLAARHGPRKQQGYYNRHTVNTASGHTRVDSPRHWIYLTHHRVKGPAASVFDLFKCIDMAEIYIQVAVGREFFNLLLTREPLVYVGVDLLAIRGISLLSHGLWNWLTAVDTRATIGIGTSRRLCPSAPW